MSNISRLRRAHLRAHEHISEDGPGLKTTRMIAALILTVFAVPRILGVASFDTVVPRSLLLVAILIIVVPDLFKLAFFAFWFMQYARRSETLKIVEGWEPDELALKLYYKEKDNADYPIGGAIEILAPGNLTRRVDKNGWSPEDISIQLVGSLVLDQEVGNLVATKSTELQAAGELKQPNWPKYSLKGLPPRFNNSSSKPTLDVSTTDYFCTAAAARLISEDRELRRKYVSTLPPNNRIPNSLCLHVLCEFSDRRILMLKRSERAWYHPGAFSISFEEQLSDHDFVDGEALAVNKLVNRALCEELFPLANRYRESPELAWAQINDFVNFARIWSVFMEEQIGGFALFCHVSVGRKSHEYCELYRAIKAAGGRRDIEGQLFVLEFGDVKNVLAQGDVKLKPILVDEVGEAKIFGDEVLMGALHPTSRYRLLTWALSKGLL